MNLMGDQSSSAFLSFFTCVCLLMGLIGPQSTCAGRRDGDSERSHGAAGETVVAPFSGSGLVLNSSPMLT